MTFCLIGALCLAVWIKSGSIPRPAAPVAATSDPEPVPTQDANGWTLLPHVAVDPRNVIVLMPANCPGPAAQRGRAILAQLRQANVPCAETDSLSFRMVGKEDEMPSKSEISRFEREMHGWNALLRTGGPVVIVNGKAKHAPFIDEVISEYSMSLTR